VKSSTDPATITVHVPMTFTIRGGRKMVISEVSQATDEKPSPSLEARDRPRASFRPVPGQRTENALLKALARAHRWRRMIEGGEYASITELAKAEKVNQSYACRMLRLTLLAPCVIVEILNGQPESDLMLKQLMKPLPINWDDQIVDLELRRTHSIPK
jgi:hypothetical protein